MELKYAAYIGVLLLCGAIVGVLISLTVYTARIVLKELMEDDDEEL